MSSPTGAQPPHEFAWQLDKTAASIDFVLAAEEFLRTCRNPEEAARLEAEVARIKSGEVVLTEWRTVAQFLGR